MNNQIIDVIIKRLGKEVGENEGYYFKARYITGISGDRPLNEDITATEWSTEAWLLPEGDKDGEPSLMIKSHKWLVESCVWVDKKQENISWKEFLEEIKFLLNLVPRKECTWDEMGFIIDLEELAKEIEHVFSEDWILSGNGIYYNWEDVEFYMEPEVKRLVQNEFQPDTTQQFYNLYCGLHYEKFGEDFLFEEENPQY